MSKHVAYIGVYPDGRRYPFCCCGWKGNSHTTAIAAIKQRDEHLAATGS